MLQNPGDNTISADGIALRGGLFLHNAAVDGVIRLIGAKIVGQVSADDAILSNLGGNVLLAADAKINGSVILRRCRLIGDIQLGGSDINNQLIFRFVRCEGKVILDAARIGSVLAEMTAFLRGISLRGTEILRNISLSGSRLRILPDGEGRCLDARDARIQVSASLTPMAEARRLYIFIAYGVLDFRNAELGGDLNLRGALLLAARQNSPGLIGVALNLEGMRVLGDVLFGSPQEVRHSGATARVRGRLILDRLAVDGALVLSGGRFRPSRWPIDEPTMEGVLSAQFTQIGTRLEVLGVLPGTRGIVDLRGCHAGILQDDGGAGWGAINDVAQPAKDADGRLASVLLRLDGFAYDRMQERRAVALPSVSGLFFRLRAGWQSLSGSSLDGWWERRHAFLMRQFAGPMPSQDDYNPQPFEQVIRVLRQMGHSSQADEFARRKREFQLICQAERRLTRHWRYFVGACFGHYYRPLRATITLLVAVALGTGPLLLADAQSQLVVKRTAIELTDRTLSRLPAAPSGAVVKEPKEPCWNAQTTSHLGRVTEAFVMSLDLLLPLVDLHLSDRCEVDTDAPDHAYWAFALALYSVLGLLLVPMYIATVSGLARRD